MEEFSYEIHDELGMHARAAGMLAKLASGYKSNIMIGCEKGTADAKRLITLMKLGIQQNTEVKVTTEGEDEKAAAAGVLKFMQENL